MYELYKSVDVAERIRIVAKEKNISLNTMFSDIGLGKNTLMNFKTSMPKADNLAKIADYLEVSTDYLLGRTEEPQQQNNINNSGEVSITGTQANVIHNNNISEQDEMSAELLKRFKTLSFDEKIEVFNYIKNKSMTEGK